MEAATRPFSFAASDNVRAWQTLAEEVTAFQADVVVCIARKTPRIQQALKLHFGPGAQVVSDLAIPFMTGVFDGARVAVIDDVVNVGSTLRTACEKVAGAGAEEVRVFVLAACESEELEGLDVRSILGDIDRSRLPDFASLIAQELQRQARPYDLDFPVLRCQQGTSSPSFAGAMDLLRARYGESKIWDLSSPRGAAAGVWRAAVAGDDSSFEKVRLYMDANGLVNVVPLAVSAELATDAPHGVVAERFWDKLIVDVPEDAREARARLRLFCDSLSTGTRFLAENADWLVPESEPLDVEEACLVLGPRVRRATFSVADGVDVLDRPPAGLDRLSPFIRQAEEVGFVGLMRERSADPESPDILSMFMAIFDELAELVGANAPAGYRWPDPKDEKVAADTYLRLRIGPTANDLVHLLQQALDRTPHERGLTQRQVTRLLDRFVDGGSVVPTVSCQGDTVWRIYRKGESQHRVAVAERTWFALKQYGRPVSRTRLAKIMAAMAFSDNADSMVEVQTLERGNVATFKDDLLDSHSDLTGWLRDAGHLKETDA